jgi:hypothetical protein
MRKRLSPLCSVVLAIGGILLVSTGLGSRSVSPSKCAGISLRAFVCGCPKSPHSSTTLIVLVCNNTGTPIFIDRHLSDAAPINGYSSLIARVLEAKTGKPVGLRALFKRAIRTWGERDIIELEPHTNYGPTINLADYFDLRGGKTYRVTFCYRTVAPLKVGHTRIWKGQVVSEEVIVSKAH